ncbi:acetoin utilization AcuB family protein [Planomicrobium sp. CPCC 101079]|uniref:acetoin utilization AcuB family protein n=1 Tax=Planomicrobium sp. CPCC 101079 TaxID=2599618 RepID=UPI0011B46A06|nr:acetoin utilization AcuB family protein [Planomicrobium sp. CPCC 101079]TWT12474.1 CBS domain-containing protein [Planomicrobium sp. CPCC 101079]
MLVEEIMKTNIHLLRPDQTVKEAVLLFEEKHIRHAPIVEDGKLVGVLSDRDLKDALPSRFATSPPPERYEKKIESIMTKNPVTAHPMDFVEEIALVFYEQQIGCLPVISGEKLVGFLTETDLLYKYIELTGAHQPGSQIEIKVPNRSGVLYEVSKVFYEKHINVLSVLVYPDKQNSSNKVLVFRVQTMNPLAVINDLRKEGFDVLWPNIPKTNQ